MERPVRGRGGRWPAAAGVAQNAAALARPPRRSPLDPPETPGPPTHSPADSGPGAADGLGGPVWATDASGASSSDSATRSPPRPSGNLEGAGLDPAPPRSGPIWRQFLTAQAFLPDRHSWHCGSVPVRGADAPVSPRLVRGGAVGGNPAGAAAVAGVRAVRDEPPAADAADQLMHDPADGLWVPETLRSPMTCWFGRGRGPA
jgi:hypothetical protein